MTGKEVRPLTYIESLEDLAKAVGLLLDGPTDDATNAMDDVISAYDASQAARTA